MTTITNENIANAQSAAGLLALTNTETETNVPSKPRVEKEDLVLLSNWAKVDLFEKVKFLYNPEKDLQINGRLFKLFVNDCKDRLVGLKGPQAVGEYRRMYVELLWQEANQKKKNIVNSSLVT
jgi:hypothetical protein